jgi:hypothetical protein
MPVGEGFLGAAIHEYDTSALTCIIDMHWEEFEYPIWTQECNEVMGDRASQLVQKWKDRVTSDFMMHCFHSTFVHTCHFERTSVNEEPWLINYIEYRLLYTSPHVPLEAIDILCHLLIQMGTYPSIIGRKIKTSTSRCDTVVSLDMLPSEVQLINFDGIAIDACIVRQPGHSRMILEFQVVEGVVLRSPSMWFTNIDGSVSGLNVNATRR